MCCWCLPDWMDWGQVIVCLPASVVPFHSLPLSHPRFSWTCLSLLLYTVGSFSEHLDQINGRSECVDSTDNSSKPSSEAASHMARQRLESTEKKKISGKVTKSLSASALSLMIPGGRESSTRMNLCALCMCSQGVAMLRIAWSKEGWSWCPAAPPAGPPPTYLSYPPLPAASRGVADFFLTQLLPKTCFLSFSGPSQVKR